VVRARVLQSAERLFSRHGFEGVSLRDVAKASGISMGLIQYHFKSKDGLYEAVRAEAMRAYLEAQRDTFALPPDSFGAFLRAGMGRYFEFLSTHPTLPRLAMWAELEGDHRPMPGEDELMDRLVARVRAAQASGQARATLDPELVLIAAGGLMAAWRMYRDRHAHRLGHLGAPAERERAYFETMLEVFIHGLAAPAPPRRLERADDAARRRAPRRR
jgi:TetR/AcrR family transcriptional regulator